MIYHGIDLIITLLHPEQGLLERFKQTKELHDKNLYTPAAKSKKSPVQPACRMRLPDGSWTDLAKPAMGSTETPFGRNIQPGDAKQTQQDVHRGPDPLKVSTELLHGTKKGRKQASTLNVLAAAWIQFQVHDWFEHKTDKKKMVNLHEGNQSISFASTKPTGKRDGVQTFSNTQVHWWDGSQIYGSDEKITKELRSHQFGKIKLDTETDIDGRPLLPPDPAPEKKGFDLTGFNNNWWVGLSLLHTMFVYEHNAICDELHQSGVLHPPHAGANESLWNEYDNRLFETARLINVSLMAKIHTVEWSPAVLDDNAMIAALYSSWWGVEIPDMVLEYFPRFLLALVIQELAETGVLQQLIPLATWLTGDLVKSGVNYNTDKIELITLIDNLDRRWSFRETMEWLFNQYEALRPDLANIQELFSSQTDFNTLIKKLANDRKIPPSVAKILQDLKPLIDKSKSKAFNVLRLFLEHPVEKAIQTLEKDMAQVLIQYADDKRTCEIAQSVHDICRLFLGKVIQRIEKPERTLHDVDYAMTEEFVSVYRMHPLLPEAVTVSSNTLNLAEMLFGKTRNVVKKHGMESLANAFGTDFAGALTLNNQPSILNRIDLPNDESIDLGAVDIYRDRERGVPRYKRFRELLRNEKLDPDFDYHHLTKEEPNGPIATKLKKVYGKGNIDNLDLMVGLYAEPAPDGFAFCDTTFRVFSLMAPRRLAADPFFTSDYGPELYTKQGMDWINNRSMHDLLRHIGIDLHPSVNAFVPWHVRDHSGHAEKSRQFRNRMIAHYFDRGIFIRKPKGQRFIAKIEQLAKKARDKKATKKAFLIQLIEKLIPRSDLELHREDLDAWENDYRSGADAFWVKMSGKKTLVVSNKHAIKHVLENSPQKYGPGATKERGMSKFQPHALTITNAGCPFDARRAITEESLGFGRRVHKDGQQFLRVVNKEIDSMDIKETLAWHDIDGLAIRLAQNLVLGYEDKDILSSLEMLMERGNIETLMPSSGKKSATDRKKRDESKDKSVDLKEFESMLDSAYKNAQQKATLSKHLAAAVTEPSLNANLEPEQIVAHGQLAHWMFAIRGTFAVHTIYTLYLLARHPNTQQALYRDMVKISENKVEKLEKALLNEQKSTNDRLSRLEKCILEAARLWPAVPLIGKRATGSDQIPISKQSIRINKDDEILIHNVANNRDRRFVGQCPHSFKPDRWKPRGIKDEELQPQVAWYAEAGDYTTIFSNGIQTCPGRDIALLLIKAIVGRLVLENKFSLYEPNLGDELPVSLDQFSIKLKSVKRS